MERSTPRRPTSSKRCGRSSRVTWCAVNTPVTGRHRRRRALHTRGRGRGGLGGGRARSQDPSPGSPVPARHVGTQAGRRAHRATRPLVQPHARWADRVTTPDDVVFLLDCDNTLLDNDRVAEDLRDHLVREFGPASRDRYWAILEQLRGELGYVDYLGALQRYRLEDISDTRVLLMSSFLVDYPFASRLYPGALDVIRHLRTWGLTVILSDGDVVFQP